MSNKIKILVADCTPSVAQILKSFLDKEIFDMYEVYDGSTVLQRFYDLNPSLVILDLMLPDLNGAAICKEIRQDSQVPILIVTSQHEEKCILSAFEAGVDDYIIKPFNPKELDARVNALLRRYLFK